MTQKTLTQIDAAIATIDDGGANTAAEMRQILTDIRNSFVHGDVAGFDHYARNSMGYPSTLTNNAQGFPNTLTMTTPTGTIVKTYGYDGDGDLLTITLSGEIPAHIPTVKTFQYDGQKNLTGYTYA